MKHRCNGCGRTDLPTETFRCVWPDAHVTIERYCGTCRLIWQRQLKALGAKLEKMSESGEERS